jgi:hypothetical protein
METACPVLAEGVSRVAMSYQDFFEDSASAANDKFALSPDILAASREEFEELMAVAC